MRSIAARSVYALLVLLPLLLGAGCENKLTLEVKGKGSVNVLGIEEPQACTSPLCEFVLPSGAEVTLRAAPLGKGVFQSWGGDCIGPDPSCALTLDGDANVKARFIKKHKITLTVKGDGKVQSEDGRLDCPGTCEAEYTEGEEVRLRRQGGTDVFSHYSGDCTDKDCSFIAKKDASVHAVFTVPAGDVLNAGTFGAAALGDALVDVAFDDKGGWAIVSLDGKTLHVARYDADGKSLYSVAKQVGKASFSPAAAFYGDDLVVVTASSSSSTLTRIAPDGKTMRYNRLHKGCPAFTEIEIQGDAIFAAGAFGGDGSTCGDAELIASGGQDIVVGRFAIEDGGITWISQFGTSAKDTLGALSVSRREDAWVGYNQGDRGGRLVRLNPAGKAYPEVAFGKSDDTQVLDLQLQKNLVAVSGHVYDVVDFGGGNKLGVAAKDGAGRAVWVQMDEEGRHKASKLVARSRCGSGWLCAFDDAGGFVRLPISGNTDDGPRAKRGRKKKKGAKRSGSIRFSTNRLGDDGAERWSGRVKGSGFAQPAAIAIAPDGAVFVVGALEGEMSFSGREQRIQSRSPSVFWIRFKG